MTELEVVGQSFLPEGYTVPDKAKQFMKLEQGDNLIRVLSAPLLGWVIFTEEKKPIRKKLIDGNNNFTKEELIEFKAKKGEDGHFESPKHFWMLLVWDYKSNSPKVLEITQVSIIKQINTLLKDDDWGDVREFNMNIIHTGSSKNDTEYEVVPKPHKPLPSEVDNFLNEAKSKSLIDLEAIWDGGYPFEIYNW